MRHDWGDRFVTMLVAILNPATNELVCVNAGHMAPILRRQDGSVTDIGEDAAGLPLGVAEGYEYEAFQHHVEPGDLLTMFTDGFSEAMNNERDLYGIERLRKQLGCPAVTIKDFGQHILEDVNKFVDGYDQSDDMCLVCLGRAEA
jgi:serine phosphatase RsbU (regulator of sigma subunit)